MNILITGGAGFIGSHLSRKFLKHGCKVTILDNFSSQIHGNIREAHHAGIATGARIVTGDVRDRNSWLDALQGIDAIVHLAAETGTGQSMYQIERYVDTNIQGVSVLLDLLVSREASVKKIILASSRALYGEGKYINDLGEFEFPGPRSGQDMRNGEFECKSHLKTSGLRVVPTDELAIVHPHSIYGLTKQAQEQMILMMQEAGSYRAVSLRYQNVYGPGQSLKNPYTGILSIFSTLLRQNQEVNIFEDGLESRDFVYIDDVVEATYQATIRECAPGAIYNIGSGKATTVMTVAETLKQLYQSNSQLGITGNFRLGDIRHNVAAIDKARQELGYEPQTDFNQGIRHFANWVMAQPVEQTTYSTSLDEMRQRGLLK